MSKDIRHSYIEKIIIFYGTISYALFLVFWGTGYNLFGLNISSNSVFYIYALSLLFIFKVKNFTEFIQDRTILTLLAFILVLSLSIFNTQDIIFDNDLARINENIIYLFTYVFKIMFSIFIIFLISNLIRNESDISKFLFYLAIMLLLIISILSYIYIFIFGASYVGISTEEPLRSGKNSLGAAIAILLPFILTYFVKIRKNFLSIIFIFIFIVALFSYFYYLNSRAAIIILFIEFIFFSFYYQLARKVKFF